jgi:hypothetical protein
MRTYLLVPGLLLVCCGGGSDGYTLYRNSVLDANARYHIASFDSSDGDKYNNENCSLAAELFKRQSNVTTRFWCEKGPFQK